MTRAVVIMGPSGSGKSTLGQSLAQHLGWAFIEGDALHPPGNVAKMAAGVALDDADREPFLRAVAHAIRESTGPCVVACSALKRKYRDSIREESGAGDRALLFVLPKLDRAALAVRLEGRSGHFMPESLLDSQLAALEAPVSGENALVVDGTLPAVEQARTIAASIASHPLD